MAGEQGSDRVTRAGAAVVLAAVALAAVLGTATPAADAAPSFPTSLSTSFPSDPLVASVGTEAALPTARPGASLLLGGAPREVAFVLDGPLTPSLPLLTTFRDASIERWGPLRVYTNGRWGRWMDGAWWSYAWEPMLGPGDDAASAEQAASTEHAVGAELADGAEHATAAEVAPARADAWSGLLPPLGMEDGLVRDRSWLDRALTPRARPIAPLFDTSGANLASDGFGALFQLASAKPPLDWRCRRRPITIVRWGAESDSFELLRCDGSIPPGAHDRLSILARPPEVPWPGAVLPDEPDPGAWAARREWLPDVRMVHPRLLWALQRIADEFPRRSVYVVSGYRPLARVGGGTMDDDGQGHRSLHADGRALDLHVQGVPNEDVFKACRALKDVGCGYYPSSRFVHVDVRRAHTGKAFWIDASAPGEPSRYVDSWPGVVDAGAMGWLAPEHRIAGP